MADETCVEVNCCPLGYSVQIIGGTLSLAGDDTTATDPRIASGDFILAEEAKLVRATLVSGNQNITVNSASNLQLGFGVECIGVYKTVTATAASNTVVVSSANGLKIGQLADAPISHFSYGTTITNIVGTTVTLSSAAINSGSIEILFRPLSPPLIVGTTVVIPSTLYPSFSPLTRITNIVGTTLTLSAAPTAPMTDALLTVFPVDLNPNVFDEAELFT